MTMTLQAMQHPSISGTSRAIEVSSPELQRELHELDTLARSRLGEEAAQNIRQYFEVKRGDAYKVTGNSGSSDCWINAPENWYLKNDKGVLVDIFKDLIENGKMTKADFFEPDAYNDPRIGKREGASLAFDRAVGRDCGALNGATDFTIEKIETYFNRGHAVLSVYNGLSIDGRDGSKVVDKMLDSPEAVKGTRCSIRWLEGSQQHTNHQVTIERIENGRVYFYQSVSVPGINGPVRRWEGSEGLESMSLNDFRKAVRTMLVPASKAPELEGKAIYDPAYFQPAVQNQGAARHGGGMHVPVDWVMPDELFYNLRIASKETKNDDLHLLKAVAAEGEDKKRLQYKYRDLNSSKEVKKNTSEL